VLLPKVILHGLHTLPGEGDCRRQFDLRSPFDYSLQYTQSNALYPDVGRGQ